MTQYQVSFAEAVRRAFTVNYCNFKGRASRSEYWWVALLLFIVSLAVQLIFGESLTTNILTLLIGLATLLPSLGLVFRRLHDTGRSGWWYIGLAGASLVMAIIAVVFFMSKLFAAGAVLYLLVLAACITVLVFLCLPSEPRPNRYGPVPNQLSPTTGFDTIKL